MRLHLSFMFLILLYPPISNGMETAFKAAEHFSSTEYLFKAFNIGQFSKDDNTCYAENRLTGQLFLDNQINLVRHLFNMEDKYLVPNSNQSTKGLAHLILTEICTPKRTDVQSAGFFHGIFSQFINRKIVTGISELDSETIQCINAFKETYKGRLREILLFESFLKALVMPTKKAPRKVEIGSSRASIYLDETPDLPSRASIDIEKLNYEAGITTVDNFCSEKLLQHPGTFVYEEIKIDGKILQAMLVSSQQSQEFLRELLSKFVSINAKSTKQSPAEYARGAAHRLIKKLIILGRLTLYGGHQLSICSGISESFGNSLDPSLRSEPKIKAAIDTFNEEYLNKIDLTDEIIANYHLAQQRSASPDRRANTQ